MRWVYIDNRAFYCHTDPVGFFDIDYVFAEQYDSLEYCPQDTTGFFDFAQQP